MGIAARLLRLCQADLHGRLDRMEDRERLLKHYLREMKAALVRTQAQLDRRKALGARMARDLDVQRGQVRALEEDIALAVARGKEDLARKLIRAVRPRRRTIAVLAAHLGQLRGEIQAGAAAHAQQAAVHAKIRCKAMIFAKRQADDAAAMAGRGVPPGPKTGPGAAAIEMALIRTQEALKAGRTP